MAISQNDSIKATEVVDALDKKVNTSDVLALWEIEAGTDLTGKVASASITRDGFLFKRDLPDMQYIKTGKLVVVKVYTTISSDFATQLPTPATITTVTLRGNINGNFSTFYLNLDGTLSTDKAANYTSGNICSGMFVYLAA